MNRKRAFTLVETLFALGLMSAVGYYLFSSFIATTKLSVRTQTSLGETLFARMILEKVTDSVQCNPAYIEQLMRSYGKDSKSAVIWGTQAKLPDGVHAPDGQAILTGQSCPFLDGAVPTQKPGDPSVPADATSNPFAEMVAKLELARQEATTYGGQNILPEMTTRIAVKVLRVQDLGKPDQMSGSTLSTEILTPVESMSVKAAEDFGNQFPLYDAKEAKARILAAVNANDRYSSSPWDDKARQLLTSMLLLYRNVRLEEALTRGVWIGPASMAPSGISSSNSIDGLVQRGNAVLASNGNAKVRQTLAGLEVSEAEKILDAFKLSQMVLQQDIIAGSTALADEVKAETSSGDLTNLQTTIANLQNDLENNIPNLIGQAAQAGGGDATTQIVTLYQKALDTIKTLRESYKAEVRKRLGIWLRTQLFRWFMQDPSFAKILAGFKDYPGRFTGVAQKALALDVEQLGKPEPTPLQKVFAAQDAIELREAIQLYGTGAAASAAPPLDVAAAIKAGSGGFAALDAYGATLRPEDPLQRELSQRFPLYAQMAQNLAALPQSIDDYVQSHQANVDQPVAEVGAMAPSIIRVAIQASMIGTVLQDPKVQSGLHLTDDQRNAIASGQSPTGGDLVGDVGDAYKMNMANISGTDYLPPRKWADVVNDGLKGLPGGPTLAGGSFVDSAGDGRIVGHLGVPSGGTAIDTGHVSNAGGAASDSQTNGSSASASPEPPELHRFSFESPKGDGGPWPSPRPTPDPPRPNKDNPGLTFTNREGGKE